ncbi:MAG: hypothetical protein KGY54_01945 [Oleiphilaceae bacterium]|nr:hypothetical protein [Oleiphilaceae bacterium]
MNRGTSHRIVSSLFIMTLMAGFAAFAFGASESGQGEAEGQVSVTGRVESINGRIFTLTSGERLLTVDTSHMDYNPLKRPGLRSIEEEDRVTVTGRLTDDGAEPPTLKASKVVLRARGPGMDGEVDPVPDPDEPAIPPNPVLP